MKLSSGSLAFCLMVAMVVALCDEARTVEAVTCSPLELSPCLEAIRSGAPPSATCCEKLKEQQPCFCEYIKNPVLKPYIDNPNAKKVASACGVPFPQC
ncbi:non-specific lipid-transfer protein 2-like [Pyrus ussuriensis x Pyrus communis]|uniref:Non-specific lipid-transfer protein 2-like n=1 Tax=Pyrus ussuriensis x Pyrus communis TaxID=2448454 RepID=A0A5N5G8U2_9ROSA|nr:non-specific lipid-transfer protein 2-like [Pyrus ussuriensis x Pyrus communis]